MHSKMRKKKIASDIYISLNLLTPSPGDKDFFNTISNS